MRFGSTSSILACLTRRTWMAPGRPRRRSCDQRLDVGPHDLLDPADPGVAVHLVHRDAALAPRLAQGLERHLETDLVPVLETVGDGLGQRVDAHGLSLDAMGFDPLRERFAGEA